MLGEDQKHHRNVNRGDVSILIKILLRSAWYRGQKNLQLINKIPCFCNVRLVPFCVNIKKIEFYNAPEWKPNSVALSRRERDVFQRKLMRKKNESNCYAQKFT